MDAIVNESLVVVLAYAEGMVKEMKLKVGVRVGKDEVRMEVGFEGRSEQGVDNDVRVSVHVRVEGTVDEGSMARMTFWLDSYFWDCCNDIDQIYISSFFPFIFSSIDAKSLA